MGTKKNKASGFIKLNLKSPGLRAKKLRGFTQLNNFKFNKFKIKFWEVNPKTYLTGFTLIEMLIVIVVVGVLITGSVISLTSSRVAARDARRLSDVKALQESLGLYKNAEGSYPQTIVPGSPLVGPTSGLTFLKSVPSDPAPPDGSCDSLGYQYSVSNNIYTITYCLGKGTDQIASGTHYAKPTGMDVAMCTTVCAGGRNCGNDGCGGSCGTCSGGFTCVNGVCTVVCIPATCGSLGLTCGTPSNGCGGSLSCGDCLMAVLVVGGGGGGSNSGTYGGGGAGGKVSYNASLAVPYGTYTVTVGPTAVANTTGNSSSFHTITSGGGSPGLIRNGGTSGNLFSGGLGGNLSPRVGGGGGGGSGSVGFDAGDGIGGNGGVGTNNSISGGTIAYAGGGGGAGNNAPGGIGAAGGGMGGNALNPDGFPAASNTGSGGGGSLNTIGGTGGSGIVIIRHAVGLVSTTGGTLSIVGGDEVHTFTTTGQFVVSQP